MIDDSCEDRKLENISTLHIECEEICGLVVNEDLLTTTGEDGYEPNLTTYNASDVTFVTPEPEPQYEPVSEEPQTNKPEELKTLQTINIQKKLKKVKKLPPKKLHTM